MSEVPFASAQFGLRYDDLTQHGLIRLSVLQLALGHVGMAMLWRRHPLFSTRAQGIVPIMSRMVLESDEVPVSFTAPVEGRGRLEVAHEPAADGGVNALFMNSFGELWGPRSSRDDRSRENQSGQREHVRLGRAFGEHVFTRPFAEPGSRKVLAFDVPGHERVPSARHARVSLEQTTQLPSDAEWIDSAFVLDEFAIQFGLTHTDANQHVNSLVYARLFEEAALRRLHVLGERTVLLARRIELNYRKPCFAGDRMRCSVRSYRRQGAFGATGFLGPDGAGIERAHCGFDLLFGVGG